MQCLYSLSESSTTSIMSLRLDRNESQVAESIVAASFISYSTEGMFKPLKAVNN